MRVLLVDPPKPKWWLLADTVLPPIGLAYLAGYLRSRGIEVRVLDCTAEGVDWEGLRREVERYSPDILGAGGPTCYAERVARTFRIAKEVEEGITTVAGGPHFTLTYEESLKKCPEIDYIVLGEGEVTLYELVEALESGYKVSRVKGIAFRRGREVVATEPRELIGDLDSLPMPAWDMLPMDRYRMVAWGDATMLVSSRGCPFSCSFCSERVFWRGVWRAHSAERVVAEMELVAERYGKRVIWFGDDTFNLDRERLEKICELLLERGVEVNWGFEGRADLLWRDRDLMPKMREAGLFWVLVGVESCFEDELERYGKRISPELTMRVFRLLRESDIVSQAMLIIGEKHDDRRRILDKADFAVKLDPDFAVFTPLTPFPGTPLYDEALREGLIEVFDYSKYDLAHAVMRTEYLSAMEVQKLM
ncbi:MAG: B12-binding domain-containing radical SAM protein, partial [Thermoprotei archaeon]